MTSYKYVLSRYIMEKSTLTGAIVFGMQRVGKSCYSLLILYDIYKDWDAVLKHVVFRIEDVIDLMKSAIKYNQIIPAFVWDDAGVHASTHLYFTKRRLVQYLQSLFDVIGTHVKGIILTTPNPENLLKTLRGYEFYRVKVIRENQYSRRIAIGYQNVLLPSGSRIIRKVFKDYFKAQLPNDVYAEYYEMRKSYLEYALEHLDQYLHDVKMAEKIEIRDS